MDSVKQGKNRARMDGFNARTWAMGAASVVALCVWAVSPEDSSANIATPNTRGDIQLFSPSNGTLPSEALSQISNGNQSETLETRPQRDAQQENNHSSSQEDQALIEQQDAETIAETTASGYYYDTADPGQDPADVHPTESPEVAVWSGTSGQTLGFSSDSNSLQ